MGIVCMLPAFADNTNAFGVNEGWTLTLSGAGQTQLKGDHGSSFGVDLGLGKEGKLLLPVEGGVRQSFGYQSEGSDTVFATKLYLDVFPVHFKRFELGLGANAGAAYGNTPLTWTAGPEAVIRFWAAKNVGLYGRVEYPLDLNRREFGDRLNYVIGAVVRW